MSDTTTPDFVSDRPHRRSSRPIIVGATLAVVALVGTWVFARSSSSADATYRTATAGVHEVQSTLDRVATIEPVTQAAVSFPVSGTVSSVAVAVGDTVTTGQALGSLDTASLQSTLVGKEAALAEAELTLDKELDGETVGGTGSVGGGSPTDSASDTATGARSATAATAVFAVADTSTASASRSGTATSASASASVTAAPTASREPSDDELRAARQAIVDAQKAVTDASATAATALDEATKVCASIGSPTAERAGTTGTATTATQTSSDAPDAVAACQMATQSVLTAQQKVSTAQAAVSTAADAYTTVLDQRASNDASGGGGTATGGANGASTTQGGSTPDVQPESRSNTTSPNGQAPSGSTGSSGSNSGSRSNSPTSPSPTSSSTAPSAADLIADQKAVDAAEAAVAVARQAVAQASIVSPIDGTVVSVGFAPGASVTAGSSTETVVVVGQGGYEVATTVSVEDLPKVKVGQPATIAVDGSSVELSGQVVRIGVSPTSSTSDTTYPVVVAITDASKDLRNGATASVSIVTDEATRVLAVPTSAVTRSGDRAIVAILSNGSVSQQQVGIGAIGREWTEIRSGLKAGATVVLADLSEALPGSATSGTSANSNRTGQFGGGPGGFVGGPPAGAAPGG